MCGPRQNSFDLPPSLETLMLDKTCVKDHLFKPLRTTTVPDRPC